MYSQYMFDRLSFNPSSAGKRNLLRVLGTFRKQFVGFEGAPTTQKLSFNAPIKGQPMGYGLKAYHDRVAVNRRVGVSAVYAYHLGFADGELSFGLQGGVLNRSTDMSDLVRKDEDDRALSYAKESRLLPDAAFGMDYGRGGFNAGFSILHLIGGSLAYNDYQRDPEAQLRPHYYVHASQRIELSDDFKLVPAALGKYVRAAPLQVDMNANVVYKDRIGVGVGYRTDGSFTALMKLRFLEKFELGYSYDMATSSLARHINGAHEVMLAYRIRRLPPPGEEEVHPRFYY